MTKEEILEKITTFSMLQGIQVIDPEKLAEFLAGMKERIGKKFDSNDIDPNYD